MASRPHVVYAKSEHARWRLAGHKGKVSCMFVKTVGGPEGTTLTRLYTGGVDGCIRVWDGKDGRIILKISGASTSAITCITYVLSHVSCF